jgi:YidC/Oxa1 family membrane protein insertase
LEENAKVEFIITPLRWIMDLIYSVVGSYGVTVILFTLVIKLLILPLDIKQRNSMRKMQDIQPKIDEINKKYEKDPEKKSAKTMELYKKEKINPLGGCLPMLIQMPILFAMFAVMRHIAGEEAVKMVQAVTDGAAFAPEGFLWIHNIWQPDNILANVIPTITDMAGNLATVKGNALLSQEVIDVVRANYSIVMQPLMEQFNVGMANGWAILPILAGASQYFTTWLMNGKQTEAQKMNPQNQSQKMMNYIFPLMSVFFCWQYNAAFSLYWVTSNVYTILTYVGFNYFADRKAKQKELEAK